MAFNQTSLLSLKSYKKISAPNLFKLFIVNSIIEEVGTILNVFFQYISFNTMIQQLLRVTSYTSKPYFRLNLVNILIHTLPNMSKKITFDAEWKLSKNYSGGTALAFNQLPY